MRERERKKGKKILKRNKIKSSVSEFKRKYGANIKPVAIKTKQQKGKRIYNESFISFLHAGRLLTFCFLYDYFAFL